MNKKAINKDFIIFDDEKTLGDLANIKLPDPYLVDYYKRLENREIYWNSDIEDDFVDIYQEILNWNKEDKNTPIENCKPIKIYINSDGGSVSAVFAIIDLIKLSKTPVITIGLGKCLSSGGLLLMSGNKGKRFVLPNTEILIHDGSTGAYGATGKVIDNLEYTKELEKNIKKYILENTIISEQLYDQNYRRDWWLFSDEAIELGIADKIITDINEIL